MAGIVEMAVAFTGIPEWAFVGTSAALPPGTYLAGRIQEYRRQRRLKKTQEFDGLLMIQRNTVIGGKLAVRGLYTSSLEDSILGGQDPELIRLLKLAASETTEHNPALIMGSEETQGQMWTAIQGAISPLIPRGAPDQIVSITCERYAEMKANKQRITIRVMLSSEAYLRHFLSGPPANLGSESARQVPRRTKLMPWMADIHFNQNGIDPTSKLRVTDKVSDPWKDDETAFLAQHAA